MNPNLRFNVVKNALFIFLIEYNLDDTSVTNSFLQDMSNSPGKILSSDIETFKVEQTRHEWASYLQELLQIQKSGKMLDPHYNSSAGKLLAGFITETENNFYLWLSELPFYQISVSNYLWQVPQ